MKSNKILEVCLSPDAGGLELYMMKLSHFLSQETDTLSVINESGKLEEYYENTNYKYEKIKRHSRLLSFLSAKKLAKIVDENSIDIIHFHWTKDLPLCVLAKLFSKRKPKVVQSRHMTMTRFKDDFYHKFLYENIDLMITVTDQVKEQIEKFIPQDIRPKVERVYIGATRPSELNAERKEFLREKYNLAHSFVVGIVGRIEEGKGQYLVLEALEKLLESSLDVKVLVVGHAMDDAYLKALTKQLLDKNIDKRVVFTGFTREVQELMQVCDTIVLATKRETFGLVLIEAMAAGIAVVASDSGGPLEIIEDGRSGLLFKTGDSSDLALKLQTLFDPRLKLSLAKNGQLRALEMFDDKRQFHEVLESLNSL